MTLTREDEEKIKGERDISYIHVGLIPKVVPLKLFLAMVSSASADNVTTCIT